MSGPGNSSTVDSQSSPHGELRTVFYEPFAVKRRQRTSRDQARTLERVYIDNPKPNAVMRKQLAGDLRMTPRGVQVWFQNRRVKGKATPSTSANNNPASTAGLEIGINPASSSLNIPQHQLETLFSLHQNRSSTSDTCTSSPMADYNNPMDPKNQEEVLSRFQKQLQISTTNHNRRGNHGGIHATHTPFEREASAASSGTPRTTTTPTLHPSPPSSSSPCSSSSSLDCNMSPTNFLSIDSASTLVHGRNMVGNTQPSTLSSVPPAPSPQWTDGAEMIDRSFLSSGIDYGPLFLSPHQQRMMAMFMMPSPFNPLPSADNAPQPVDNNNNNISNSSYNDNITLYRIATASAAETLRLPQVISFPDASTPPSFPPLSSSQSTSTPTSSADFGPNSALLWNNNDLGQGSMSAPPPPVPSSVSITPGTTTIPTPIVHPASSHPILNVANNDSFAGYMDTDSPLASAAAATTATTTPGPIPTMRRTSRPITSSASEYNLYSTHLAESPPPTMTSLSKDTSVDVYLGHNSSSWPMGYSLVDRVLRSQRDQRPGSYPLTFSTSQHAVGTGDYHLRQQQQQQQQQLQLQQLQHLHLHHQHHPSYHPYLSSSKLHQADRPSTMTLIRRMSMPANMGSPIFRMGDRDRHYNHYQHRPHQPSQFYRQPHLAANPADPFASTAPALVMTTTATTALTILAQSQTSPFPNTLPSDVHGQPTYLTSVEPLSASHSSQNLFNIDTESESYKEALFLFEHRQQQQQIEEQRR